ncbi:MAG: alpha/beta fold hydrolase [Thermomicrobiales bacterium]|nr:MAG: alpha/beta fold hydrolase [Thermomicrobiales bacterium]
MPPVQRHRDRSQGNRPPSSSLHVLNCRISRKSTAGSQLHKITCPTLVVGGRHDWICAPEFSEEIAALIPNADLRIFERSGHEVINDEPDALFDVIRGFLTYNK